MTINLVSQAMDQNKEIRRGDAVSNKFMVIERVLQNLTMWKYNLQIGCRERIIILSKQGINQYCLKLESEVYVPYINCFFLLKEWCFLKT